MKLSVRTKVANGLVIFLLMPRAAETAVNLFDTYSDGLKSFAADDEFEPASEKSNIAGVTVKADPAGDVVAGDPTGGDPTGGDPTGGDPTGGDPTGGDPTGGDPTGGDPTGGDPTGGDPTGGDPTGGDPTGGDPTGGDPTGGDPTGGDPTGGDPTGGVSCPPGTAAPTVIVKAPHELVTAEDGSEDIFEISMAPNPGYTRFVHFVSTIPDEARPVPSAIRFRDDACVPQTVRVVGQNDSHVDGDIEYQIEILDEEDLVVGSIEGVNLDNDDYEFVLVDILGPPALPPGKSGVFLVRAFNISQARLPPGNHFVIEPTPGLEIKGFAASLMSGQELKGKGKIKSGVLSFNKVDLDVGDVLLVSVEVVLENPGPVDQKITARFSSKSGGEETDNDKIIGTSVP